MKFKGISKNRKKLNIKLEKENYIETFSNKTKREIIENILKEIKRLDKLDYIYIMYGLFLTRNIYEEKSVKKTFLNLKKAFKNIKIRKFYIKIYKNIEEKEQIFDEFKNIQKLIEEKADENNIQKLENEKENKKEEKKEEKEREKKYINIDKLKYILSSMFISSGYISSPEKAYNLEILNYTKDSNKENMMAKIFKVLDIEINIYKDEKIEKIYIRKGDEIANVLAIMSSSASYLKFEEERVIKYENQKFNRAINFEMSNMKKTIEAAKKQKEAIDIIKDSKYKIGEELEKIANERIKHLDFSLKELSNHLGISRSTLNIRLKKIESIAEELKKSKDKN